MIKLVVGLGNPGTEYEFTRHNIAWILFDQYQPLQAVNWKSKWKGEYTDITVAGNKVYFLKPMTYMNLSGESVGPMANFFKIKPSEILVVQDEVDLPFGTLAFKNGGGLAGHNGLKSITQHVGTQDFYRLRLGVGRPNKGSMSSWVLSSFKGDDIKHLEDFMIGSVQALEDILMKDFKSTQNKYNKKNFIKDK